MRSARVEFRAWGRDRQPGVPTTPIAAAHRDLQNVLLDLCLKLPKSVRRTVRTAPKRLVTPPRVHAFCSRWVSRVGARPATRGPDHTDRCSSSRSTKCPLGPVPETSKKCTSHRQNRANALSHSPPRPCVLLVLSFARGGATDNQGSRPHRSLQLIEIYKMSSWTCA